MKKPRMSDNELDREVFNTNEVIKLRAWNRQLLEYLHAALFMIQQGMGNEEMKALAQGFDEDTLQAVINLTEDKRREQDKMVTIEATVKSEAKPDDKPV